MGIPVLVGSEALRYVQSLMSAVGSVWVLWTCVVRPCLGVG